LTEGDSRRPRVSCTYAGGKGKWRKYWDNSSPQAVPYFRGSGGIYSTTADYARFMAMWMDRGEAGSQRFLQPETIQLALTTSPLSDGGDNGYGYQWQVHKKTPLTFGHGGSDGTLAIAIPEEDLIFLYFTQSRGNRTIGLMHDLFVLSFLK
jgi:CubicO group peptidase (beta-lactamase class C family)